LLYPLRNQMDGEYLSNKVIEKSLSLGADRAKIIDTKEISITWKAPLLCLDCKVNRDYLMRRWSCPPFAPLPERTKQILSGYNNALIVNVEAKFWPLTNHSYETANPLVQAMQKIFCHRYWKRLHFIMLGMKRYLSHGCQVFSWGSSPCHGCFKCNYPFRCRKPDLFLFSPEASGIDLYLLAKKIGVPIEVPPRGKIQLMSLLLFSEVEK